MNLAPLVRTFFDSNTLFKNKTYFTQKMNSVNLYIKDIGRYYRQNTMKISSTFLATRKMTEKFAF